MKEPLILSVALATSFLIALLIYWIGGKISVKTKHTSREKTIPYACGEEPPKVGETRINLERFFIFAVYFLIFDVFAFLIATSWSIVRSYPLIYSIIILMAALTPLIVRGEAINEAG